MQIQRVEPWQQRIDEPDFCYRMFLAWLQVSPAQRTAPSDPGLATQYDWAGRAIAYDNSQAIPGDPAGLVKYGLLCTLKTLAIESNKLLTKVSESRECELTPKEIAGLYAVLTGVAGRTGDFQSEGSEFKIPPEATMDQINEMIRNIRKGIGH
jgi:hypothetical protein